MNRWTVILASALSQGTDPEKKNPPLLHLTGGWEGLEPYMHACDECPGARHCEQLDHMAHK